MQDILHSIGEAGITQSDYGDPDGDVMQAKTDPHDPELVGDCLPLDLIEITGLPECLSFTVQTYMYRAIRRDMRGDARTLSWTPPITCATQMKTSLEDMQLHSDDDRRYRTVTLRAQPLFQNRPSYDNVKVWIEEDAGKRLYFAKCMAFFKDAEDQHFVGLQWYAELPVNPPGVVIELTALNITPEDKSSSYSTLPAECIINGALLIKCNNTYWAVQSPREEMAYARNSLQFRD